MAHSWSELDLPYKKFMLPSALLLTSAIDAVPSATKLMSLL